MPNQKKAASKFNPGKRKQPGTLVDTSRAKVPAAEPYDREAMFASKPVWRFSDVDHEGDWAFDGLSGDALVELLKKLGDFESMTMREIFYSGEEPGKEYDVHTLPGPALKRLEAIGRDDETKLARLRLAGAVRLYGFLRRQVFHVLWWDPEHQVYPSRKRNT